MPPQPTATAITEAFGIGTPTGDPDRVPGAYSHSLSRLTTTTGVYAVKLFDRTVDHTSGDDFIDRMAEAIGIELAAIDAGIRSPRLVEAIGGGYITELGGTLVRIHEWAEATPVATTGPAFARHVGHDLAAIHRLPVTCPHERSEGLWATHDDAYVAELAARARSAEHTWAGALDAARGPWRDIRDLARTRRDRTWPLISTHRDLGPKNVLRAPGDLPVIVDWDVAGPWTAVEEMAAASVEWAGVKTGPPDPAATAAFAEGYAAGGGEVDVTGPEVFASWLVKHANWTEMHIRHALDPDAPRREMSQAAVPGLLAELARYTAGVEEWARRLSG